MQAIECHQAKILIVDDNPVDSELLYRLLARAGYVNVQVENDSRMVAEMHREQCFDLILLDHNMPLLAGLEVVEQLKVIEQDSYVPVLMVTAHHDRETRLKVLGAGCKDIISKPYDRVEIINRVDNMVEVRLLHNHVKEQNRVLQQRENELRAAVDSLEERVNARTTELVSSNNALLSEIKARKNTEKELASARDRAIEASRLKSEFLANVSHEIRTPLNGMLGMLSILTESDLKEEQEDYVKTAYRSGEILLDQINELLDFSKVEAGKIDIEYICYDPVEVVTDVLQLFDGQISSKHLTLTKVITDDVPRQVMGDPWRIRQVLINLIGNAIKFTDAGMIKVGLKREDEAETHCKLLFEVTDTGLGIAEADQTRIFESFTQADGSTTRRFGGTGLGLTISKKLVEIMGGEIGVRSKPGQGSSFWFYLIQGKLSESLNGNTKAIWPSENKSTSKSLRTNAAVDDQTVKLRVLIVEDNEINQKVAVKMLLKLNCHVDVADDGSIALEAVKTKNYDLVFMDCLMPVMDGYDCTHKIRLYEESAATAKRLPIIAMSANVRKQDQDKCYAAGMDGFLCKPVSLDGVRRVIAQWTSELESP